MATSRISHGKLRWSVNPEIVKDVPDGAFSETQAVDKLTRALLAAAHARNDFQCAVFVRGAPDQRRRDVLKHALAGISSPVSTPHDYCYIHNFDTPDRPRLLVLEPGHGRALRDQIDKISRFIRDQLDGALQSRPVRNRLLALQERSESKMRQICASMEKQMKSHGLVLQREEVGQMVRLALHVQQTGRVISQDDLANLVAKGQIDLQEFEKIREVIRINQPRLTELTAQINRVWKHSQALGHRLLSAETRRLLADMVKPLLDRFEDPGVQMHIEAIIQDVVSKRIGLPTAHLADTELLYSVNPVLSAEPGVLPIVHERNPTPRNLFGTIDHSWVEGARSITSFRGIRIGSLVEASGGFLLLDAETLLENPESIVMLRNALASGCVEHSASLIHDSRSLVSLRPDPIPARCRLIVVGQDRHWQELQNRYPRVRQLFGPPIDIPESVPRTADGVKHVAGLIKRYAHQPDLPEISDQGLAAAIETAARIAGPGKISTSVEELAGLLRHAGVAAELAGESQISAERIHQAVRDNHPGQRPDEAYENTNLSGFPLQQQRPARIYAVTRIPDFTSHCGRLIRIEASVSGGAGCRFTFDGIDTDFERQAGPRLEVAIANTLHLTKALGLRAVFRCTGSKNALQRLRFPSSLVLAAGVALFSALSGVALRQDLALIADLGADGDLLGLPGLNESIEEAYRSARNKPSATDAGVVIASAQREALMLDPQ
ncbi:MAG: AAA family ATPase, partial [Xanthomonadaceae bacterium]|nr:AAA family ATPase [Xanthomonadaceae bacterium]